MKLSNLFKHKHAPDVVEQKEVKYSAVINNHYYWYSSKEEMLDSIEAFGKNNVIFSLSMFRFDIYNLIK